MSQPDETRDYFQALYKVAEATVSSLELEEVLANVARSVTEVLHVKACALRLRAKDNTTLGMRKAYGLSERYLAKGPVGLGKSPIDREVSEGHAVIIAHVGDDPRFQYPKEAHEEGIVAVLAVPIRAHGDVIGSLRAYTGEPHEFPDREVEFVQAVASLAGLAIVNARLYDELRRDVHDTLAILWGERDQ